MKKTALITGITGQDGAILAGILLEKGYDVHGMKLYSAVSDSERLDGLEDVTYHYGDITDGGNIRRLIETIKPDEIYNLAAMSHVAVSFDVPEAAANINALGPLRILEAMRSMSADDIKLYQASSSEIYGNTPAPQNEQTEFAPCSPYASAKVYAHHMVQNYRDAYGVFASNGILFNHESPLRGQEFVTQKIVQAVCEIEAEQRENFTLGNIEAKRDWGHAHDYMQGAWRILQHDKPDDFVLATGQSHSVREFVDRAFKIIDQPIEWRGEGVDEQAICKKTGAVRITIDPNLYRPNEVHNLIGDAGKAKEILGWTPNYKFDDLVADMMSAARLVDRKHQLYVV